MNVNMHQFFFRAAGGSPQHGSPSQAGKKRVKRSHLPKKIIVAISYAAKIPLKSVALALRGSESKHAQDALRVLDIVFGNNRLSGILLCYVTARVLYCCFYLSFHATL
jgi:hypothetical protein